MDSTPYCADKRAEFVVSHLEQSSTIFSEWLDNNYIKLNTVEGYLLFLCNSRATATIDNNYIESEDKQVLLGITIDSSLTFEKPYRQYLQESKSKVQRSCKNRSLHEYIDAKNNH